MSETTLEAKYTFRPLAASDVFLMSKIIGAIGVNEFSGCFGGDFLDAMRNGGGDFLDAMRNGGADASAIGAAVFFEIANVIFNNLPKCEKDIYTMLASVSGMTQDEIKRMDFVTFTEMVIDFIKKEEFRDFIKVVSKLFK